jgi:hypothetical protein
MSGQRNRPTSLELMRCKVNANRSLAFLTPIA